MESSIINGLRPVFEIVFGGLFLVVSFLYRNELVNRITKEEEKNEKHFQLLNRFQTDFKEELKNNRDELKSVTAIFEKTATSITNSIKRVHCRMDDLVKTKTPGKDKKQNE